MNKEQNIKSLKRLLEKSKDIQVHDSDDPEFISWKDMVVRTLFNIYGENSEELKQFKQRGFSIILRHGDRTQIILNNI